ncbi:MAG: calcium/sodium antiporter [Chloroflexota bacterium]
MNIGLFLLGFVFLVGGAEFLVRGASRLASRYHVPGVVIGLTIVALGTSLPELLVSLIANFQGGGASDIAIGNIVGSNIANVGLILGTAAVLSAIAVEKTLVRREFPLMIGISIMFVLMCWDWDGSGYGEINRIEGLILFLGIIAFTWYSYISSKGREHDDEGDASSDDLSKIPMWQDLGLIAIGVVGLIAGANWLVTSATVLAEAIGVPELVIGLTLVALGTSLPELATTVVAIRRNEGDIAVGNVVGSNIYNMLLIGGANALIKPIPAPQNMQYLDYPVMLGIAILAFIFSITRPNRILRWQGGILLAVYVGYSLWLFM